MLRACAEGKVDEMEAETPEHLSEMDNADEQQGTADAADANTSKQSSQQHVPGEEEDEPPSTSGREDTKHSTEQRSSRHSDRSAADKGTASGTVGHPWCQKLVHIGLPPVWQQVSIVHF